MHRSKSRRGGHERRKKWKRAQEDQRTERGSLQAQRADQLNPLPSRNSSKLQLAHAVGKCIEGAYRHKSSAPSVPLYFRRPYSTDARYEPNCSNCIRQLWPSALVASCPQGSP
jgi:hypothetical protein